MVNYDYKYQCEASTTELYYNETKINRKRFSKVCLIHKNEYIRLRI